MEDVDQRIAAIRRYCDLFSKGGPIDPDEFRECGTAIVEVLELMGSLRTMYIVPWMREAMFDEIWSLSKDLGEIIEVLNSTDGS